MAECNACLPVEELVAVELPHDRQGVLLRLHLDLRETARLLVTPGEALHEDLNVLGLDLRLVVNGLAD